MGFAKAAHFAVTAMIYPVGFFFSLGRKGVVVKEQVFLMSSLPY